MPITAREMVARALLKANIIARGETPGADEASTGLKALNEMLFAWETDGIHIGHTELTLDSQIELPDSHTRGIRLLLAVELAPEYEKTLDPVTISQADRAKRQLIAEYVTVPEKKFDRTLTDFQANRRSGRFNINEG